MDLKTVGVRFRGTVVTVVGKQFKALIQPARSVASDPMLATYEMRVGFKSVVKPGDVVKYSGFKYLVATGVTEFQEGPLFHLLRLIEVTHELAWSRNTTVTDPVSKLQTSNGNAPLGTAYAAIVSTGKISDEFRVRDSRFRMITNAVVQVNDKVGDYIVTFVEPRLGLQFAEVK